MSKLMILFLIVIVLTDSSNSVDLKHKLTNNIIKIYFNNPCEDLGPIFNDPEPQYATDLMECKYGFKHFKYASTQCNRHYSDNWLSALRELANCQYSRREKRAISSLFSQPIVVSAATNLIKSLFTTGDNKELAQHIKNDYKITNLLNINSMNDVYHDSNNIHSHPVEARQSMQVPRHVRALSIIHKSIAAKSALVRIIAHECHKSKQLSTAELAELLENMDFLSLQPGSTTIQNVSVDFDAGIVQIVHNIDNEVPESDAAPTTSESYKIVLLVIVTSTFCTLFLTGSIIICFIYKSRASRNMSQQNELQPVS